VSEDLVWLGTGCGLRVKIWGFVWVKGDIKKFQWISLHFKGKYLKCVWGFFGVACGFGCYYLAKWFF